LPDSKFNSTFRLPLNRTSTYICRQEMYSLCIKQINLNRNHSQFLMKNFTLIALCAITSLLMSSCAKQNYNKGAQAYNQLQYGKSNYFLKKYVEKDPTNADALRKLADGYRLTNQTRKAESVYAKLIKNKKTAKNATNEDKLNYAKMLMADEKYDEAKEWFMVYDSLSGGNEQAKNLIYSCDSIGTFKQDTALYTINEAGIRGVGERFCAVPYENGIVFTGESMPNAKAKKLPYGNSGMLDLYAAEKDTTGEGGDYTKPSKLKGKINSPDHDGPCCFNKEGTVCYFTRTSLLVGKDDKKQITAENNSKLYRAEKDGNSWVNIKELPFNSNSYSVGHPSLSADGQKLYFMSDKPEGQGGSDIYVSTLDAGSGDWGEPVNLGAAINTNGNELFPYIADDNTLYFSTDARYTMGGLDVYASRYDGNNWSKPENLNSPVNTSHDDYAFVMKPDGETGYLSSNRSGKDRIFEWTRNDPVLFLNGSVVNKITGAPLQGVKVDLINTKTKAVISAMTDANGKYTFDGIECRTNYDIKVGKNMFVGSQDVLRTMKELKRKGFEVNLRMDPIEINKPTRLNKIYYAFNRWFIRKDAVKTLDSLIKKMKDNPQMDIELSSHTDSRGSARYNMWLSERRANSVVYYMRRKGIDKRRMIPKGYGETMIINRCADKVKCSESEHQENRRTEFKVLNIRDKGQQPNQTLLEKIDERLSPTAKSVAMEDNI
jgi:peptidoglycan-associated lipoprotein